MTQREFLDTTADAIRSARPGSVPFLVAALIAGRGNAEVMTLDVRADATALLDTGFRFRHPDLAAGIPAALADLADLAEHLERLTRGPSAGP